MQAYMVEYRPQRVFTVGCGSSQLNCLRDGSAERARVGGVFGKYILTGTGRHRGRTFYDSTESAHNTGTVGLLLHSDLHLINGTIETIDLSGV